MFAYTEIGGGLSFIALIVSVLAVTGDICRYMAQGRVAGSRARPGLALAGVGVENAKDTTACGTRRGLSLGRSRVPMERLVHGLMV